MSVLSTEAKLLVSSSNVFPADLVAGGLYRGFHLQVFTAASFRNSLEAFQIVGRIRWIILNLSLVRKIEESVVEVFNCA